MKNNNNNNNNNQLSINLEKIYDKFDGINDLWIEILSIAQDYQSLNFDGEVYIKVNNENKNGIELVGFSKGSNNRYVGEGELIYTLEKDYLENIVEFLLSDKEWDELAEKIRPEILDDMDVLEKVKHYIELKNFESRKLTDSLQIRIEDCLDGYALDNGSLLYERINDIINNVNDRN